MNRDMTDKQADAWFADLTAPKPRILPARLAKPVDEMTLAELEAFEQFHGVQPDASEQARRRRVHAAQDTRSFG